MDIVAWFTVTTVFFLTSIINVVTGSATLITVPAIFQLGIEPIVEMLDFTKSKEHCCYEPSPAYSLLRFFRIC
jgi:hypothetical protein